MKIYDPKTGHTKMVVDECVDPHRPNCKGCEYSLDPTMRDGGCLAGYSEEKRKSFRDTAERTMKSAYVDRHKASYYLKP